MSKIDSLRQAIRKAPNNLPLLLLHAHACLDDGQLDEAYSSLQEVLEQDKTHREARLGVARILFLNSKVSEAVVRAESLLKEDPSYAPAHMLLSRLFLQEKDRARAFSHYRQGMASDSSLSDLELEREFIREIRELRKAPLRGVKIAKAEVESEEEDWNGAASGSEGFGQADSENYQDDFDGDDDSNWSSGFISPREPIYSAVNFRHIGGYEKVKEALRVKMI